MAKTRVILIAAVLCILSAWTATAQQRRPWCDGVPVLLSNGAPSYSLWKDFEAKGALFQDAVRSLQ